MTKVKDLLGERREIFSLSEDATVHEAANYLRERQIRAVSVCNSEGHLVGVIAQSDISDKVAAEHLCPSWTKVREIMSTNLVTVTRESNVEECLILMEKNNIYHLLVLDESERSMGMISALDVLRVMVSDEKARADLLESWAFPPL
jgi:CBS domain-containing protein